MEKDTVAARNFDRIGRAERWELQKALIFLALDHRSEVDAALTDATGSER